MRRKRKRKLLTKGNPPKKKIKRQTYIPLIYSTGQSDGQNGNLCENSVYFVENTDYVLGVFKKVQINCPERFNICYEEKGKEFGFLKDADEYGWNLYPKKQYTVEDIKIIVSIFPTLGGDLERGQFDVLFGGTKSEIEIKDFRERDYDGEKMGDEEFIHSVFLDDEFFGLDNGLLQI